MYISFSPEGCDGALHPPETPDRSLKSHWTMHISVSPEGCDGALHPPDNPDSARRTDPTHPCTTFPGTVEENIL